MKYTAFEFHSKKSLYIDKIYSEVGISGIYIKSTEFILPFYDFLAKTPSDPNNIDTLPLGSFTPPPSGSDRTDVRIMRFNFQKLI